MDASALTRRRLLELAGIGLGASVLAACTADTAPVITSPAAPARPPATAAPASAAPLTVRTSSGSFVSAYRPRITTRWVLAAPEMPPGGARPQLPVAVFLH